MLRLEAAVRRLVVVGIGSGALVFGALGAALADPAEPVPPLPNCTTADLAQVSSQVATVASN